MSPKDTNRDTFGGHSLSKYLVLTPAGWLFRRRVPTGLLARIGQAEFRAIIPARCKREAASAALQLAGAMERVLSMAANDPALTPEAIRILARRAFQEILAAYERHYFNGTGRAILDDWELHAAETDRVAKRIEGGKELLRMRDWGSAAEDVENFLREQGRTNIKTDSPEFREMCLAFVRADIEANRVLLARFNGDYAVGPADPLIAGEQAGERRASGPGTPRLSDFIASYLKQGRDLNPTTIASRADTTKLITAICGDRPIADYAKSDFRTFFERLRSMPAKYGQSKQFRGKSIQECIAIGEADAAIPKFSQRTIEKHYINLKGIFEFATSEGLLEKNLVTGAVKLQKGDPKSDRDVWSIAELNQLFRSPIWTGSRSETHRKWPGEKVIRDWMYWLPLLAIYTGARLNELSSLYVADVAEIAGTACISIGDDRPDKSIKTANARRAIPVHPMLVRLGFLDHLEKLRADGEERLWPTLKPMGPDKVYSFYPTRRFSDLFSTLGIAKEFHGFRHTFIDQIANRGVEPLLVKELSGHAADKGEFARYYKGARIARLKEAIDKLDYPGLEIAHLLPKR